MWGGITDNEIRNRHMNKQNTKLNVEESDVCDSLAEREDLIFFYHHQLKENRSTENIENTVSVTWGEITFYLSLRRINSLYLETQFQKCVTTFKPKTNK